MKLMKITERIIFGYNKELQPKEFQWTALYQQQWLFLFKESV